MVTIDGNWLNVSFDCLSKLSLTELFVLKQKVIDKGPRRFRNELLRDSLIKFMEDIGIEAHISDSMVKYFKGGIMHHLNLDDESLSKTKLEYMTYMERKLRFKGWKTMEKTKAAEHIYAYRLNIMTLIGGDPYILER